MKVIWQIEKAMQHYRMWSKPINIKKESQFEKQDTKH